MTFVWEQHKTSGLTSSARATRRRAMIHREITQYAELYQRLGFTKSHAKTRLHANIAWAFETGATKVKPTTADVDKILAAVYKNSVSR